MDEKDDQIAHHRILAGREIPTNYGRNNNSPATRIDLPLTFSVSLRTKEVLIAWGDLRNASRSSVLGNAQCFMVEDEMRGIRFFDLLDQQITAIQFHTPEPAESGAKRLQRHSWRHRQRSG
jgi:hypothetical protein